MRYLHLHRYWINQPSTLQPLHEHHGKRVICTADAAEQGGYVYFADNTPLVSIDVPANVLSPGWPTHL